MLSLFKGSLFGYIEKVGTFFPKLLISLLLLGPGSSLTYFGTISGLYEFEMAALLNLSLTTS